MSTRCTIHFHNGEAKKPEAIVYRHSDGYPGGETGVLADMQRFFGAVEEEAPGDTRFHDPSYLAAKFVVWQARENNRYSFTHQSPRTAGVAAPEGSLAFLGVGVVMQDPGDIEYRYHVRCGGGLMAEGRPTVRHEAA